MTVQNVVFGQRYRVQRELGRGGMGAVFLAEDTRLPDRLVAVKENTDGSTVAQERFAREAMLLARLRHPNLPQVTDYFVDPGTGRQYLVMEYIDGEDLQKRLRRKGPLPETEALDYVRQVMLALDYMHHWVDGKTGQARPVIHRDVKPANIRLMPDGRAVLVDFGIAKVAADGAAGPKSARALTPGYSPLEQYTGGTDQRSDIYSLGATLYALLTGRVPPSATKMAAGEHLPALRTYHVNVAPPTERAIDRAMQVKADKRYQSVAEMYAALYGERLVHAAAPERLPPSSPPPPPVSHPGPPPSQPRRNKLALTVGLLLLAGLIAGTVFLLATPVPSPTANGPPAVPPAGPADTATPLAVALVVTATATSSEVAANGTPPVATATATDLPTATSTPAPTATSTATALVQAEATAALPATLAPDDARATTAVVATQLAEVLGQSQPAARPATRVPATSTPLAARTPLVTQPATPAPTATAAGTATSTRTAAPTKTLRPAPTNTRVPTPKPVAGPKATPVPPAGDDAAGPTRVTINFPPDGYTSRSPVEISWTADRPLAPGQEFEVVFWQAPTTAQETAPGWVRSGTAPSINVTLRDHAPGDYRWGVYLVRPDPYVRLRYLGGGYLLHIADGTWAAVVMTLIYRSRRNHTGACAPARQQGNRFCNRTRMS